MFIEINDLTVHVDIQGPTGAPVLLLLHSLGTSLHVWDPQVAALGTEFRIIRPDLRGHGLTSVTTGPYTIEMLAGDALALLDALGVKRAHVVGLSIGGLIAQAICAAAPDRALSLVLCDTAMAIPPPENWHARAAMVRANGVAAIADAVLERWVTPGAQASAQARGLRAMLLRTGSGGLCQRGRGHRIRRPDRQYERNLGTCLSSCRRHRCCHPARQRRSATICIAECASPRRRECRTHPNARAASADF